MPSVKFEVTMKNLAVSGDQALSDIMKALGPDNPNAANPIRDAQGKLVRVEVSLPDHAAERARNAINDNPGVSKATPPLPTPFVVRDLSDDPPFYGIHSQVLILDPNEEVAIYACDDGLTNLTWMGSLTGDGATNTYQDGADGIFKPYAVLALLQSPGADGMILQKREFTIYWEDVPPFIATVTDSLEEIIVPSGFQRRWYYIDEFGRLYLGQAAGSISIPPRTYADAVAAGRV
jgi:hypothetical protein